MNFNLDLMVPYEQEVKNALLQTLSQRHYIMGPELRLFEEEFAAFTGQSYAVGVGSGTDALRLGLLALGVGPGDEVISPAFNVAYTALAVSMVGATNVFVDCDPRTLLMDLAKVHEAITSKTRAIIPVHLYGQMIDMKRLEEIVGPHGVMILEDAAQCHGATFGGEPPGRYSHATAYSFYPTKNLGCLGDGGGVTTNIAAVAGSLRLLRDAGRTDRYLHTKISGNGCLDEIQAAVLRVKLRWLPQRNRVRRELAARYIFGLNALSDKVTPQAVSKDASHVYHLFVMRAKRRDALRTHLEASGVPTLIHYPIPVPYQPCFMGARLGGPWPHADQASREIVSLPMHPDLSTRDHAIVLGAIRKFYET